jgi:predicted dehydrogenase
MTDEEKPDTVASGPVRVALVGCGYWGPNLARVLHQLPGCRLASCCDLDQSRLAPMKALYPETIITSDYQELLASPEVEAIALATPARTHYGLGQQALLAGKHLFVEKPLAMSSAEGRELIALAREQSRILMVGHIFEYNPAVLKIKELLDAGEIGQVYYIYSNRVNLGRVQWDINALWSIAPHDISILLFLLGTMPLTVSAHGARYLNDEVEDVVFLTLNFPNRIMGHVQASWLDPSKTRQMTIVGSHKMIVYDDVASEGKVRIYEKGVYRKGEPIYGEYQYRVHSGDIHIPKIEMSEPLANEVAHFVECVRTGARPRSDGENGLRVLLVLEAAQESLRNDGAMVRVGSAE